MINGIINVYKERGYTSHDVVAKLRGIFKQKKIGHTGTLDPDAVGVLPVCFGKATKLCDMLTDTVKTYIAVMKLGVETDTQDTTGNIVLMKPYGFLEEEVEEVILKFKGEYDQIPPMYSALKVNGKKLYELARKGIEVERQPRRVKIYDIKVLEMILEQGAVTFEVKCSKGTYIRTLCHDIGQELGCGACMDSLERIETSGFTKDTAITLEELESGLFPLEDILVPIDRMFKDLPAFLVKEGFEKLLYNGNMLKKDYLEPKDLGEEFGELKECRIYDRSGEFVGVYAYDAKTKTFKLKKMFYSKDE